jgi:hypothetical protein
MGGALATIERSSVSMADLREQVLTVYDRLLADEQAPRSRTAQRDQQNQREHSDQRVIER